MRHSGLCSPFAVLTLFASLVVISCGDSGTCSSPLCDGATAASVATVAVTAATTSLTSLGATVQLQAAAKDTGGNTITGKTFTWSSSNQDVVTVDTSGLATAVGGGTATIMATTDGIGGSLALTVAQTVATIEVTPAGPLTLTSLGATESLTAVAKDSGGAVVAGVTFAWASDNEASAAVAPDGTVTAVANGVANITASASGVTSNAVEVTINTTLTVTTTSLPNGALTIAYSVTLAATGGDGNYTWLVASGSLLSGLNLNTSAGEISGTPTVVETLDFTVQVTSGDGETAQRALSITVNVLPTLQPAELCSDNPASTIATFEDANLEAVVRASLELVLGAQEDLTCELLSGLQTVSGGFIEHGPIESLVGLQNLTSLKVLLLLANSITDISPLSGLTTLVQVQLNINSISNISALSELTNLTILTLASNSITNLNALSGLTSLTNLDLSNNSISDITVLSGLTNLTTLSLNANSITDISVLSGLPPTPRTSIGLANNPDLTDIQPLLNNTGLGEGDDVDLRGTMVSCEDVVLLAAKGVTVTSDCTPAPVTTTLSVTGITDPIIEDASSNVTVTALDQFGNVATGYTGTVAFTSSDGAAALPANYTFTGPDGGIHVFAGGVTLATVGEHSVTATDVAVGTITGSQTAITVQAAAAATNFSEDFEGGEGGFSATNGIWTVGLPTSGPNECHSGVQCAGTVLDGNYPINASSHQSPTIILPAIGATQELHLRFWHWFSFHADIYGTDVGRVQIQERISAGVWSASTQLTSYSGTSGGVWTLPVVDLSAYGGKTVRILFELDGNNSRGTSSGWYFDDISVVTVQANNVLPYADNFESGLGNWWAANGSWEVGGPPTVGPESCNSGTQCAGAVLDANYPINASSLHSPTITLPTIGATQELHLRFWHWFSLHADIYGTDLGRVYVQERTSPGVWSASTQLTSYSGTSGGVWTLPVVDLSAYGGKTVRIHFNMDGNNSRGTSSGWYIDDVSIVVVQANNVLPYSDNFESGIGNWWASNGSWEVGGPSTVGPASYNGGTQCAGAVLDANYPINASTLHSPTITLPTIGATQELHLRFWHWFSLHADIYGTDLGRVYVQERTSPGVWSASTQLTSYSGTSGGVWTLPVVDLSAYGGKTVRIHFNMDGNNSRGTSSGWYIDDVSIVVN